MARSDALFSSGFCLLLVIAAVAPLPAQAQGNKGPSIRRYDPDAINSPPGYAIEAFAIKLDFPVDITFGDQGEVFVAEAGLHTFGVKDPATVPPAQIIQLLPDGNKKVVYDNVVPLQEIRKHDSSEQMPEGLIPPITGITWHEGKIYVSHRSRYSVLDPNTGEFRTIVNGLPMWGEFLNGKPIFDRDGKMVFHVSSQGNSGVIETHWMKVINLYNKPNAREIPGETVQLTGQNYPVPVDDPNTPSVTDSFLTGVYMPLGVKTTAGQTVTGEKICNGAFYHCNPDGSQLERIAWGFRSCFGYRFSPDGRLICTQNSANPMPPRGLWYDFESVYEVVPGEWYGWPDFYSGIPITDPRFEVKKGKGKFVLTDATHQRLLKGRQRPIQPLLRFKPHAASEGFVFGRQSFGIPENNMVIAQFGTIVDLFKGDQLYSTEAQQTDNADAQHQNAPGNAPQDVDFSWPGFRVQTVDLETGRARDFLVNNRPGPATAGTGNGLERPIQIEWGPDGAMYVVDFGVISLSKSGTHASPHTGAIWKVSRSGGQTAR